MTAAPARPAARPPGPGPGGRDPGASRARTELAWTRTAISFAALGGAVLKTVPAAGLVILALGGLVWIIGRLARSPARPVPGRLDRPRLLALITAAVAGVSVTALIVALLAGQHSQLR